MGAAIDPDLEIRQTSWCQSGSEFNHDESAWHQLNRFLQSAFRYWTIPTVGAVDVGRMGSVLERGGISPDRRNSCIGCSWLAKF